MKDAVRASAEVVSCHALPRALVSNAVLELDVSIAGAARYRVQCRCNAPTRNWPQPGGHLPVTIDRANFGNTPLLF